jgi:D-glycero-D-manno-heptose 1,7-bisphosphate phosphatase
MGTHKAVFLDKDGTLIPDIPHNVDHFLITLSDKAVDGLRKLQSAGYKLIVVTNQSGIAKGLFKECDLIAVHRKIMSLLRLNGVLLDGFYYCPHDINGKVEPYNLPCDCRKPQPGMLLKAAEDHQLDLQKSWMIGDILNDVECGNRAGCKSILIDNKNETEWLEGPFRTPLYTANTINEACDLILGTQKEDEARLSQVNQKARDGINSRRPRLDR